jgi:hypothetical protein
MAKNKQRQDTINQDDIEQEYGLSWALFQAFPELKTLLKQAVGANWDPSRFQVELRQTEWFKKHSDIWRQNTALKFSDPTTYQERLANSVTSVQNLAGAFGASLGTPALKRLAERALLFGMSEDQIRDQLAGYVVPSAAGHYGGQLSSIEQDLRSTALQNGVRIGDGQVKRWMREIVRGNASQDQYQTFIRDVASKTFGAYGEQIKGGMNMADLASPYTQSMSQILEMNPGSLDMFDATIRKAMAGVKDQKTGKVEPMSITDFEDMLRQDRRWLHTKQAKDSATEWTRAFSQVWGLG